LALVLCASTAAALSLSRPASVPKHALRTPRFARASTRIKGSGDSGRGDDSPVDPWLDDALDEDDIELDLDGMQFDLDWKEGDPTDLDLDLDDPDLKFDLDWKEGDPTGSYMDDYVDCALDDMMMEDACGAFPITCFSFDLDDTLYPITPVVTAANDAVQSHCGFAGHVVQDTMKQIRVELAGEPIRYSDLRVKAYQRLFEQHGTDDQTDVDVEVAAAATFDVWLNARNSASEVHLYPDVVEALTELREQFRDANGMPPLVIAITNGRGNVFGIPSLAPLFDLSVSGEDDAVFPNRKPAPEIYEHAVELANELGWGGDLSTWWHVGDCMLNDVDAARNVGMRTVHLDRVPVRKVGGGHSTASLPSSMLSSHSDPDLADALSEWAEEMDDDEDEEEEEGEVCEEDEQGSARAPEEKFSTVTAEEKARRELALESAEEPDITASTLKGLSARLWDIINMETAAESAADAAVGYMTAVDEDEGDERGEEGGADGEEDPGVVVADDDLLRETTTLSPATRVKPVSTTPHGGKRKVQGNAQFTQGVKLVEMLETLIELDGWEGLADMTGVRCFQIDNNPTIKSSLKFLRNPDNAWARKKVEDLYVAHMRRADSIAWLRENRGG